MLSSSRRSAFFALLSLVLPAAVSGTYLPKCQTASCVCGYIDSNGNVWREALESDFTSADGAIAAVAADWDVQEWLSPQTDKVLGRQHVAENVYQFQDGLALRTTAYDGSGITKVAEIDSKRSDILYGTFRTRAVVPNVPGVCFGFFTYFYDFTTEVASEIDIEILTADEDYASRAHYTNQPGNIGDKFDPEAYRSDYIPGADFTGYGEHRFDWLPGQTSFYYNGEQKDSLRKNVPTVPSKLMANLWSNGNPFWTRGPPTEDAVAKMQYIKAYFNSTTLDEGAFSARCAAAGGVPACAI